MDNLTDIITNSIQDVELPDDPIADETPEVEPVVEASPDVPIEPTEENTDPQSPTAKALDTPVLDDFDKKYGLAPNSSSGRENRIPYSRVKKIADNSAKDAVTKAKEGWTKELTTTHVPATQYQELVTKVTDYEARLQGVAQFEDILLNHPVEFLKRLAKMEQYAPIFNGPIPQETPQAAQTPPSGQDTMPQPDQDAGDGSKVYSMDGLNKLLEWQARQVEGRVTKQIESRYKPLEDDYKRHMQVQQVLPQVQRQIEDARTWKLFNENEAEIVKVLQQYPDASLERAYQYVVWPKLQAEIDKAKAEQETLKTTSKVERDKIRAEVLAELKQAPKSTALSTSGVKAGAPTTGPRSLEDIIKDQIKDLK